MNNGMLETPSEIYDFQMFMLKGTPLSIRYFAIEALIESLPYSNIPNVIALVIEQAYDLEFKPSGEADNDTCTRCLGVKDAFIQFTGINGGKCFRCNGTGKEPKSCRACGERTNQLCNEMCRACYSEVYKE